MILPDANARVVLPRSVVFDERMIVQRIWGTQCARDKLGDQTLDCNEEDNDIARSDCSGVIRRLPFNNLDA